MKRSCLVALEFTIFFRTVVSQHTSARLLFFTFSLRIIVISISIIWSFLVRHWNWEHLAFIIVTSQQDLRSLHWFLSKINVRYIEIQRSQESLMEIKVFDRKTSFFAWHVLHCSTECDQSFFYLYYVTSCNRTATYFACLFISRPHGPCSPSHVSSYLSFLKLLVQSKKGSRTVSLNICRVSSPFFCHRMSLEKWWPDINPSRTINLIKPIEVYSGEKKIASATLVTNSLFSK